MYLKACVKKALTIQCLPPASSHSLWLNWPPPTSRPDMAFSLETNHYLALYGEWTHAQNDERYANWATEQIKKIQQYGLGIQLADENLGRRPARFMKGTNLQKLDILRERYNPTKLCRN